MESKREEPRPQRGIPESVPASLLVIHGHSFSWTKSPSPPLPGCSFIAESQALHAISRLSAFAPAVPSAKCLLHCPSLTTTSSFFKAQLGCNISPCVASPRVPSFATCPSLHGLLGLHLYLFRCDWVQIKALPPGGQRIYTCSCLTMYFVPFGYP